MDKTIKNKKETEFSQRSGTYMSFMHRSEYLHQIPTPITTEYGPTLIV